MNLDAKRLLAFIAAVGAMNPDDSYMAMADDGCESLMAHCKNCYYYSDVTVETCELEHEPTRYYKLACKRFEPKEVCHDIR